MLRCARTVRQSRRFAIGCSVAGLLAVAGFVPAAASGGASSSTICVGLVIDSHSIGGSVSDRCVNVKPGTTGVGVLEAAGHAVTFRQDGLLCTIDGVPDTGCSNVDNSHYWAYFHRAPDRTTWSYSVEDARTYQPANRSTEGWVYDDGSSLKPADIPASQICAGLVKPSPTPTPSHSHSRDAGRRATHSPTPAPAASTSPAASLTARPMTTGNAAHPQRSRRLGSGPAAGASTGAAEPTASPSAAAAVGSVGSSGSAGRAANGRGSATGALVAAGVIAVIAAATVIGARRRRR